MKMTLQDAYGIASRNRPWSFRLEFVGHNGSNLSGTSSKFWQATGRGLNEPAEAGWGAIGNTPQTMLTDWQGVSDKVAEKLAKGYTYVDHPYIKMTPENLAKVLAGNVKSPVSVTFVAPAAPVPPPVITPMITKTSGTANKLSLVLLGEPWSLIVKLRVQRNGLSVTGYLALDDTGDTLLTFDEQGGLDFAREHSLDIEL